MNALWRDPERGWLGGVCAGLSDYTGIKVFYVRLAFIAGLLLGFPIFAMAYGILWAMLRRKPTVIVMAPSRNDALRELRDRFGRLEQRLIRMEGQVTSAEFDLHRKFRDIGG